jgi:hypothetical protein
MTIPEHKDNKKQNHDVEENYLVRENHRPFSVISASASCSTFVVQLFMANPAERTCSRHTTIARQTPIATPSPTRKINPIFIAIADGFAAPSIIAAV